MRERGRGVGQKEREESQEVEGSRPRDARRLECLVQDAHHLEVARGEAELHHGRLHHVVCDELVQLGMRQLEGLHRVGRVVAAPPRVEGLAHVRERRELVWLQAAGWRQLVDRLLTKDFEQRALVVHLRLEDLVGAPLDGEQHLLDSVGAVVQQGLLDCERELRRMQPAAAARVLAALCGEGAEGELPRGVHARLLAEGENLRQPLHRLLLVPQRPPVARPVGAEVRLLGLPHELTRRAEVRNVLRRVAAVDDHEDRHARACRGVVRVERVAHLESRQVD